MEIREIAGRIVDGDASPVPFFEDDLYDWSLLEGNPTSALEAAPILFLENFVHDVLSTRAFAIIGTYMGDNHFLILNGGLRSPNGVVYRDMGTPLGGREDRRSRIKMSKGRLREIREAASKIGVDKMMVDGRFEKTSDPNGLLIFSREDQDPEQAIKVIREFAFKWGYKFDQDEVIVNDPSSGNIHFYRWGWGENDDSGEARRLYPIQSPIVGGTATGVRKAVRGDVGWTRIKRQLRKDIGWRYLWGLLRYKFAVKNYTPTTPKAVGRKLAEDYAMKITGGSTVSRDKDHYRLFSCREAPKWRLRPLGEDGILARGMGSPFGRFPTYPLAKELAEQMNWPVVMEPEDGGALLERSDFYWTDLVPSLGTVVEGERIKRGTFVVEPPSWESVDDLRKAREDREWVRYLGD